jgi:hypothetical protein
MQPTSKRKPQNAAQKLKRKVRRMFKKRRARKAPAEPTPPQVRLPGAALETFKVKCVELMHAVHVVRSGHAVKAIITPCGVRATIAAHNLGADTCAKFVLPLLDLLRGQPGALSEMNIDDRVWIKRAADEGALDTIENLRRERRTRANAHRNLWADERRALTVAALPKLIAHAAGPGAEVWFQERRAYIQFPGQETPSCYVYDTGSWSAGPGPQAPDHVWHALKRWARQIESVAREAKFRGISAMTPGYRPF